jgi:hypothetical protein
MNYIPVPSILVRPVFTYLRPCGPCPSDHGTDPESEDILTYPDFSEVKDDFTCAWRKKGFCAGWAKKLGTCNRKSALPDAYKA